MLVQKQTLVDQRTRFKVFVAISDYNGHSTKAATTIRGAFILIRPILQQRGYCGTRSANLIAPFVGDRPLWLSSWSPGALSSYQPVPKLLLMAGVEDC
jgi:hypothetical protein